MQRTASGREVPDWVYGREILVHKVPEVREDVARYVCEGAEAAVKRIGVDLKVRYVGEKFLPQIREAIEDSTIVNPNLANSVFECKVSEPDNNPFKKYSDYLRKRAVRDGILNSYRVHLAIIIEEMLDGRSAHILATSQILLNDSKGPGKWDISYGMATLNSGLVQIDAYAEGYSERLEHYFRSIAFHEVSHLNGIHNHPRDEDDDKFYKLGERKMFPVHEDFTEKDMLRMREQCTMIEVGDPTMQLCPDHLAQARTFWKEVEEATGERFLKEEAVA